MQQQFTYDELTPLEQCIAEFMAKQHLRTERQSNASRASELSASEAARRVSQ